MADFLSNLNSARPCFFYAIQLMIIEMVVCFRLEKRKSFWLRAVLSISCFLAVSFFIPANYRWLRAVDVILLFIFSLFLLWICFQHHFSKILFLGILSFATENLIFDLINVFLSFLRFAGFSWQWLLLYCLTYAVVTVALYFFLVMPLMRNPHFSIDNFSMFILAIVLISVASVLVVLSDSELLTPLAESSSYASICCLLIVFVLLRSAEQSQLKEEKKMMERLLQAEERQHEISKKNIDLINFKCHDLKHQISSLKNYNLTISQQKSVSEIEKSVMFYDDVAKTGCPALDVILTEQSLFCEKNHIQLSYLVDGKALSFLDSSDIASFFDNAISNAIEAVMKISESDKRIISMRVMKKKSFLSIHIENCYKFTPTIDKNGLPETTKNDSQFHGFGTKSMQYIIGKYSGTLIFKTADNLFCLDALIPVPEAV